MTDMEKTKAASKEGPGNSEFKFSCCDFDKMSQMMGKFCCCEGETFDCKAMMEKMCAVTPEKSDQQ